MKIKKRNEKSEKKSWQKEERGVLCNNCRWGGQAQIRTKTSFEKPYEKSAWQTERDMLKYNSTCEARLMAESGTEKDFERNRKKFLTSWNGCGKINTRRPLRGGERIQSVPWKLNNVRKA